MMRRYRGFYTKVVICMLDIVKLLRRRKLSFILVTFIFAVGYLVSWASGFPRVEMELAGTNNGDSLYIFYENENQKFDDSHCKKESISSDLEKYSVSFPESNRIRIDIGTNEGKIQLRNVELRNGFTVRSISADELLQATFSADVESAYLHEDFLVIESTGGDPFLMIKDLDSFKCKIDFGSIIEFAGIIILILLISVFLVAGLDCGMNKRVGEMIKNIFKSQEQNLHKTYAKTIFVILILVYATIFLSGKMYMYLDIGADTYSSQLPSIAYAKHLISDFKFWDFQFGLGSSTVVALPLFFDPFNWIIFLFSDFNLDIGILISTILKYIVLSYYAYKYLEIKGLNGYSRIISALMITFSGWFVGWGQHYTIATIFVFYVALLYYFEDWMKNHKFLKLILTVALLAINSFYYCYMALVFLVFYYLILLFYRTEIRATVKKLILNMMQTGIVMVTGLLCAMFVLWPNIENTMYSPRVSGEFPLSLELGSIAEYVSFGLRMFSNSIMGIDPVIKGDSNFYELPFMYVGVLAVLLCPVFLLSVKRVRKYWTILLLSAFTFIFVNFSSVVFNGFSTKTYRWTFVFVPLIALLCGKMLESWNQENDRKRLIPVIVLGDIGLVGYGIYLLNNDTINKTIMMSLIFSLLFLNLYAVVFFRQKGKKNFYKIIFMILSCELCLNAYISVHMRNMISQSEKKDLSYYDNSRDAIEYLEKADSEFYRISKTFNLNDLNDCLIQHYNGEKIYTSVLSEATWDLMQLFDLNKKRSNYLCGFDDKQILRNITRGKYRLSKNKGEYFGYKFIKQVGDIYIYENLNCAGFGVLYNDFAFRSELTDKDSYELQNILLQKCILEYEETDENLNSFARTSVYEEVDQTLLSEKSNITKSSFNIKLNSYNSMPLILELYGDDAKGTLNIVSDGETQKNTDSMGYSLIKGKNVYYIDTLNVRKIKVIEEKGKITGYRLFRVDGKIIEQKSEELKERSLKVEEFSDEYISGTTDCERESLLFIPIPYNLNWKVEVNGEETKIYRANAGFMAVMVPEGEARISMHYIQESVYVGCAISGISIVLVLLVYIADKKRKAKLIL